MGAHVLCTADMRMIKAWIGYQILSKKTDVNKHWVNTENIIK